MSHTQHNSTIDIESLNQNYKSWFNEIVERLRTDQMLLEEGVASTDTKGMYDTLIFGKETEISAYSRVQSSMYFVKSMLKEYFEALTKSKSRPVKLGLELSDAKIMVWAEVNDDDESAEDALILSEARANAKYGEYGFHITSTIVEASDGLSIPPHYQTVIA